MELAKTWNQADVCVSVCGGGALVKMLLLKRLAPVSVWMVVLFSGGGHLKKGQFWWGVEFCFG